MRHFVSVLALSSALIFTAAAHADTISFTGAAPNPGADTLTFFADTVSVTPPGFVSQLVNYAAGDSGYTVENIPFSFQEDWTVNGITKTLTFTGTDSITHQENIVTLDRLGYVQFGDESLIFQGFRHIVTDNSTQIYDLTAEVGVTPEPSALALCGTGILAVAGMARRKFQKV